MKGLGLFQKGVNCALASDRVSLRGPALGVLFLLVGGLVTSGCSFKPHAVSPDEEDNGARTTRLYVVDHGWHVGVAITADALESAIPELEERFSRARFYELGWGDSDFYPAGEITMGAALRAILWSRGTVVHVAALPDSPPDYFAGIEILDTCLTEAETESVVRYLARSLKRDADGNLLGVASGLYGRSRFFAGEGGYHLLNTSNKWVAKALQSAGMDIVPAFKLTAGSVMSYVRENREACDPSVS